MSVRKRTWTTAKGERKVAWVADIMALDAKSGKPARVLKTFDRKKDADTYSAETKIAKQQGALVADRDKTTVAKAAQLWLERRKPDMERSSWQSIEAACRLRIVQHIGDQRLADVSVPSVKAFEDRMRDGGVSKPLIRKTLIALGMILADAQESGLIVRNAVRDLRRGRGRGVDKRKEDRQRGKLKIGIDIPAPHEIRAVVAALDGRWRPVILTAIFTGLRSSELRGLTWNDVDFDGRELHVTQRADRFNQIGKPKSEAGERTVPLPPMLLNELRRWKLACPKGELGLVFPNGQGKFENHSNIINRGLIPAMIAADVTTSTGTAKYTGLHQLRHFYASWCINRKEDGGLGLPGKVVQERLGHATIAMTMDTYGHLFPRGDNGDELAEAERLLRS